MAPYPDSLRTQSPGSPYYRPLPVDVRESAAERCRQEAKPYTDEIEAVAFALGIFWDHSEYSMDREDVDAARAVSAWLQTMPDAIKRRVLWSIADERRKSQPLSALVVLGRRFEGEA